MDSVDRVKNMVRHSLIAKPDITNRELLARAREIAPQAVEGLSLRQFHARFRLPIMRHEMGNRRSASNGVRAKDAAGSRSAEAAAIVPAAGNGDAPPSAAPKTRRARGSTRSARKTGADALNVQAAIRDILLEFAVQLEEAETRGALIRAVGGVDAFVDRIAALTRDAGAGAT